MILMITTIAQRYEYTRARDDAAELGAAMMAPLRRRSAFTAQPHRFSRFISGTPVISLMALAPSPAPAASGTMASRRDFDAFG